jgi:hypothetical protein
MLRSDDERGVADRAIDAVARSAGAGPGKGWKRYIRRSGGYKSGQPDPARLAIEFCAIGRRQMDWARGDAPKKQKGIIP